MFKTLYFVRNVMIVVTLVATVGWADNLSLVTSQAGQNANDVLNWAQLGADGTVLPATFAAQTGGGAIVQTVLGAPNSIVSRVCPAGACSWTGGVGLAPGDSLVWTSDAGSGANGPITLNFANGISGGGTFIQADGPGAFTATIRAYNGGTLLGTFNVTSDSNGDAIYIGVLDQSGANITALVFTLANCNPFSLCTDFAIDTIGINSASGNQFFTLTLATNPSGAGTIVANPPSQNGRYLQGTNVCVSALPNQGWLLTSWSGDQLDLYGCLIMDSNKSVTANFSPLSALQLVPITPCRLVDTRVGYPIRGGTFQTFNLPGLAPLMGCPSLASATAFSLNITVVPQGQLGYLTIWPTGETQPLVSTLNSWDGRVKSDAAIVLGGVSQDVNIYVSDTTNVIIDIDGYFQPSNNSTLAFYPLPPCRVADTRNPPGDLGGPRLVGGAERSFPVLEAASCNIPPTAQAYSLNLTAVPPARLGYLTVWPTGQSQPNVSTLNAPTGLPTADAAIVPAGTNGAISAFALDDTDLVIDINGYFAAPGQNGLSLYPVNPCRVLDTRKGNGAFKGTLTIDVLGSVCAPPQAAEAYVFNATVVPPGPLGYLTLWPHGGSQPLVSTLNAYDGAVTSNMAIVPNLDGKTNAYASDVTQLVMDIYSYFAP